MKRYGFLRAAAAVPRVRVANVERNVASILELAENSDRQSCAVVVFPELCLTGYSCGDLFAQRPLLQAARAGLGRLADASRQSRAVWVVGLPFEVRNRLYNVAAVLFRGDILGMVPKSHIPNYKEFYERRWFQPADGTEPETVRLGDRQVPFGIDLLFEDEMSAPCVVGVELCEDLWVPIPPSSYQALAGATLLVNPSASNESTGKSDYRRELVVQQSARCIATYIYVGAGVGESTTDLVFGGDAMIAENGQLLARSRRFERSGSLTVADVDLERLVGDRRRMTTFSGPRRLVGPPFRRVPFRLAAAEPAAEPAADLIRPNPAHPFVPGDPNRRRERCEEIFHTQVAGLAKRLEHLDQRQVRIGVSGGLDSTLALVVTIRTFDRLGWDRRGIGAATMPGFGTSRRTLENAGRLMDLLGVAAESIDIRPLCLEVFRALDHSPLGVDAAGKSVAELVRQFAELPPDQRADLVFENVQARIRTLLLMNRGFVVGTGDLSELALGWCTYNADHLSMYNPNVSIPKTLVRFLVDWAADHEFDGPVRAVLHSILETDISPELLPPHDRDGVERIQSTEATIGPYELHDFFLYHVLRFGFGPRKIEFLAGHAHFDVEYTASEIRRWLREFYTRFFRSQYKRSCLPDGPKVGSVSLSPRGDWRMPSDADLELWLAELA